MALVKLEIDGRRVIADSTQTILHVARQHGIADIPTLCHDEQLEPFASCFLCVVKVKGARTLLPACSTRVSNGMVVTTNDPDIRRSRKTALELLLSDHYADCLGPCQLTCPAAVDVQGYVALAAIGKYRDAVALIKARNPLPSVCGRVCTRPCEVSGCRRNLLDEPVAVDFIKRYLTDLDLGRTDSWRPEVPPPNGHKVAIVGAGPGGLSCAWYLALRGYDVHVFESQPEAGGMLRYGIPEYRLPKDVLDLEINQILGLGVTLKTNTSLGKDFTINSLKQEGYDAIFLAIGAWRSSLMRVQDENSPGVLSGIEFLKNFGLRKKIELYGRVVVVGGGNTAIDCARTALRLGVDEVRLLYRRTRTEMPANAAEIHEAAEEGVALEFLVAPVRVVTAGGKVTGLECLRMELGEPDASGRRSPRPIRGSEFVVPCDFVISAIGQSTTISDLLDGRVPGFLPQGEVLNLSRWQTVQVNEQTFETSVEGVFSGGDLVTGAATAIEAIAAGRRAAHAIDAYVRTGAAEPEPVEFCSRRDAFGKVTVDDLRWREPSQRRPMPALPVAERIRSFAEVEQGYSADDVKIEVQRCQECGCSVLFDCDLRRYATEYGVEIKRFLGDVNRHLPDTSHPLIQLEPSKCILCGRCVRVCSEVVGLSVFGFVNRGFGTVVQPSLGDRMVDTDCVSCGLCLATCPTGAINQKISLAKPGPWKTQTIPSVCHYCGTGCRIGYDTFGDTLVKVSRVDEDGLTFGNHCRRGRFGYEYVHSNERLATARIRPGRELQPATPDEAIGYAAMRLKELTRRYSGREVAVFASPLLTNEELYLAQKLARVAFKTHNVTSFSQLANPPLASPEVLSTSSYRELIDAQAVLVLDSNLSDEHFVVDLLVKRAVRKGAKLIYVGPRPNHTSHFADVFLRCAAGAEATVLAAVLAAFGRLNGAGLDDAVLADAVRECSAERLVAAGVDPASVEEAAKLLWQSIVKVMVFNKDYHGPRFAGDARFFAAAASALGCSLLPLHEKANTQGLLDMGVHPEWYPGYLPIASDEVIDDLEKEWCVALREVTGDPDVAQLLRERKIRVAIVLGEDPLGCAGLPEDIRTGLLAADFLVVGDLFFTETARAAHVVLPLSSSVETDGTMTNSERRVQRVRRAVPPPAGIETWAILCRIAAGMGYRFKMSYDSPAQVLEEIRRVAPIYRNVVVDGEDAESIWDLSLFPLPRAATPPWASEPLARVDTAALDCLEVRFHTWFDQLFEKARAGTAGTPVPGLRS
ncbi:MAG: FAD-dependent oxidoreductase [Acidobacteria bacterium]|nr:FAD-dependent oxidoreductase [Acidobacteriota bacterium]